jgi:hypothetical protein
VSVSAVFGCYSSAVWALRQCLTCSVQCVSCLVRRAVHHSDCRTSLLTCTPLLLSPWSLTHQTTSAAAAAAAAAIAVTSCTATTSQ